MKFLLLISLNALFLLASPFLIKSPQNSISFLGIEEKDNLNKDPDRKILIDLEKLANDEILLISKRKALNNQKDLFDSYNLSLNTPKDGLFSNVSDEELRTLPKIHKEQRFIMQEVKINDSNVAENNTSNIGEGLGIFVIKTETNPEKSLQSLTIPQENMTKKMANETVSMEKSSQNLNVLQENMTKTISNETFMMGQNLTVPKESMTQNFSNETVMMEQSSQNLTVSQENMTEQNKQNSKNETEKEKIGQNDENKQNATLNDTKENPKEEILNITINLETVSLPCDNLTEVENFIEKKAENNTLTDITKLFLNNSSNGTNNSQIIILFVSSKDKKSENSSGFRENNVKIQNPNTEKLEKNLEDLISINSISGGEISDAPLASSSEILKLDEIVSSSLLGKNHEKLQLSAKIPEKDKNTGSNETEKSIEKTIKTTDESTNSSNNQNLTNKNGLDYKKINQNSTESKKNDFNKEKTKMDLSQKTVTSNIKQSKVDAPKKMPLLERSETKASNSLFSQNSSKTSQNVSYFVNNIEKIPDLSDDLKNDSLNVNDDFLKLEDFPAVANQISNETSNFINETLLSNNQSKIQQKTMLSEEKTKIKKEVIEVLTNENLKKPNEDLFSYKTTNETIKEINSNDVEKDDQIVEVTAEKMENSSKIQENVKSTENDKAEEKTTKSFDSNITSFEPVLKASEQIESKENISSEILQNEESRIDLFQNTKKADQNITDKKNDSAVTLSKVEKKEPLFKPLNLKEVKQVPPNIFATPITIQELSPKSQLKSKETTIFSDKSGNNDNFETMRTSENLETKNEALSKTQEIQETTSPKESNESITMAEKTENNHQNSSLRMISLKNISENETYQYSESPSIVDNLPSVIRQRTEPMKMTSTAMLNMNENPLKTDGFVEIRKMSIPTSLASNQEVSVFEDPVIIKAPKERQIFGGYIASPPNYSQYERSSGGTTFSSSNNYYNDNNKLIAKVGSNDNNKEIANGYNNGNDEVVMSNNFNNNHNNANIINSGIENNFNENFQNVNKMENANTLNEADFEKNSITTNDNQNLVSQNLEPPQLPQEMEPQQQIGENSADDSMRFKKTNGGITSFKEANDDENVLQQMYNSYINSQYSGEDVNLEDNLT